MKDERQAIHFALTSHGLGHLTRSLAVISELTRLAPTCHIQVSTTVNVDWIARQLDIDVVWRQQDYEPGALQHNCFTVDPEGTLEAYSQFYSGYQDRLEKECEFLTNHGFAGVVSDISALAVRAASQVGIPAVGVANFTWDWILEPWCGNDRSIVDKLVADYATGSLQLCLPFGPKQSSFQRFETAPLVSRRARLDTTHARKLLALGDQPIALVCPGGWEADDWPQIHARTGGFQLLTVGDLPISSDSACARLSHQLPDGISFPDLVAAADVVLGKPGYGLASECATHKTPFAMIERPDFREAPVLFAEFQASGRCSSITMKDFFAGSWREALESASINGSPWIEHEPAPAQTIARRLVEIFGLRTG